MNSTSLLMRGTLAALASLPLLIACGGSPESGSQTSSTTEGLSGSTPAKKASPPTPECTGGLPDICEICADGKSECAHWGIEDGKCVVEICPGPSTTPPPPPPPTPVPDCTGGLPDICEICADGKSECAHWGIEDGKCVVEICPPSPSTTPPAPTAVPPIASSTPPAG